MCVLPACMPSAQRLKESIKSPGSGVLGGSEPRVGTGNQSWVLSNTVAALKPPSHLFSPFTYF